MNFPRDLDLSNTYKKSLELLKFSKPTEKGLFSPKLFFKHSRTQIPSYAILQEPNETMTEELKQQLSKHLVKAKSKTDRDPVQFGHMCPQPGRNLPEVTIS